MAADSKTRQGWGGFKLTGHGGLEAQRLLGATFPEEPLPCLNRSSGVALLLLTMKSSSATRTLFPPAECAWDPLVLPQFLWEPGKC